MIYLTKNIPSKVLLPSLLVVLAFLSSVEVALAKRARLSGPSYIPGKEVKMRRGGCALFGHSCFGGHGKRSVHFGSSADRVENPIEIRHSSDAFIEDFFPHMEIFSRDEGQLDANDLNLLFKHRFQDPTGYSQRQLLLKKWLYSNGLHSEITEDK